MFDFKSRLMNLFGQKEAQSVSAEVLKKRINRAAETILGNETLAADLDDDAAKVLIDWALARARSVAQDTTNLDDAEAEEVISNRLRAIRRMLRPVQRWAADPSTPLDAAGRTAFMAEILEQAAVIYGDEFSPPGDDQQNRFWEQQSGSTPTPVQSIANLRQLLEKDPDEPSTT